MAYINKLIRPTRRGVLRGMGAGLAASVLGSPAVLRAQTAGKIRMGYITPETGPLGLFGETDGYTVQKIRDALGGRLQSANGDVYEIEILERDSQSNPNKAAEIAGDLILNDEVHLLVPASTTDTILPAMEQAELYETPSISAGAPWQAVIMPRGGGEFDWTYHFFWGLDEALNTFVGLWNGLETNRKVGMLFPQNIDGETWGNEEYGLPVPTRAAGYEVTIPGYFQPRTNDFSAQIATFKQAGCDIIGGITYPDDLKTFVTQCNQQGFKPKATVFVGTGDTKETLEAMGADGVEGLLVVSYPRPDISEDYGPGSKAYLEAYRAKYGEDPIAPQSMAAFVGFKIMAQAINKAGSAEPEAVSGVLGSFDEPLRTYETGFGAKFDDNKQNQRAYPTVIQWQGGKQVTVFPDDAAGDNKMVNIGN